jgi:hypothetical protein
VRGLYDEAIRHGRVTAIERALERFTSEVIDHVRQTLFRRRVARRSGLWRSRGVVVGTHPVSLTLFVAASIGDATCAATAALPRTIVTVS